jgi:hypothetical protein
LLKTASATQDVAEFLGGNFMRVSDAVWKPGGQFRLTLTLRADRSRRLIRAVDHTDVMPLGDALELHLPGRNAQGRRVDGLAWVRWTIFLVSGRLSRA